MSESYPMLRSLLADILISDEFPKILSKCMLDTLNDAVNCSMQKSWLIPQMDSFINSFFVENLLSSIKLQSAFHLYQHSSMVSIFLKNRSTQFERINQLINRIDKVFFMNEIVQQILLRSQQHHALIDKLIEDDKCVTFDKLSDAETSRLARNLQIQTKNIIYPGFDINILNSSSHYLTGKQQEHITKIILNDFLQVNLY